MLLPTSSCIQSRSQSTAQFRRISPSAGVSVGMLFIILIMWNVIMSFYTIDCLWVLYNMYYCYGPVGRAVTRSFRKREVLGFNFGPVKSDKRYQRLATAATFLWKELCCPGAMTWRWTPQTRYTLRRNTTSIMKNFVLLRFSIYSRKDSTTRSEK